ncbi:hypothetical protein LX36DRAFT_573315 [Colletotrichum falcatum]|nr:hypothetical protein LX36DRAFT_573315 [Colletotrichum falcatum]
MSSASLAPDDYLIPHPPHGFDDGASTSTRPGSLAADERESTQYKPVAADEDEILTAEYPRGRVDVFTIMTDIIAAALPLAFIVLVIWLWCLDGFDVTTALFDTWDSAVKTLATVFPILFALVVGRLMSEASRYKLERGASVGSLEQLMGSRTVGATVLTLCNFRSFNVLGVSLLLTWALSPLGSQGFLRMMTTQYELKNTSTAITYFDNSAQVVPDGVDSKTQTYSFSKPGRLRSSASLYAALVLSPQEVKSDSMDLWGNLKIPMLSHTGSDWMDVTQSSAVEYSSLAGIPLSGLLKGGNATFPMESSYVNLECRNFTISPSQTGPLTDSQLMLGSINSSMLELAAGPKVEISPNMTYQLPNGTWHGYGVNTTTTWSLALDRFVDPIWTGTNKTGISRIFKFTHDRNRPMLLVNETRIQVGPTTLMFLAVYSSEYAYRMSMTTAYCGVTQKYVESRVRCSHDASRSSSSKPSCSVVAQRPSQKRRPSEEISHLSFPKVFNLLSKQLPLTVESQESYGSEVSLYYLGDPSLNDLQTGNMSLFTGNVTAEDLGIRLSQLINTYLAVTQLSFRITGGNGLGGNSVTNISASADTSELVLKFHIFASWAAVALVSSIVMFAAGILGVVYKHRAHGPEILGYVSTVFRDSKFMELPVETRQLDGVDLSRTMMEQRIRYGITKLTKDREPLIGVGTEKDTELIKYTRQ